MSYLLMIFKITFLALSIPRGHLQHVQHKMTKRNFVPNRFDIVDNEIKRKDN